MNIKKKNYIISLICMFIFACLLAGGIFAAVSKTISFNLALTAKPNLHFALTITEVNGSAVGENNAGHLIFDNRAEAEGVVPWATVNQNCIVLNQVMAGNAMPDITPGTKITIKVTNYTEKADQFLHLGLNYSADEYEDFVMDNGYGVVNVEYNASDVFTITAQNILANTYIQIPFLAEIDTTRYTAVITTTDCKVVEAPRTFVLKKTYTAEFTAPDVYYPQFSYTVTIGGQPYAVTTKAAILQIPADRVTGNIVINCAVDTANLTVRLDTCAGIGGTKVIKFTAGTNKYYDLDQNEITTIVTPTKTHYNFAGYYQEEGGIGTKFIDENGHITQNFDGLMSDTIMYAYWVGKTYSITYMDENNLEFSGSHGSGYPTTYNYDETAGLIAPTKAGYTFSGWYLESDCSGEKLTELTALNYGGDITLYAKWTANSYTITYKDQNNANFSGTNASGLVKSHTYGTVTDLTIGVKSGYNFLGWYTDSACTGSAVTSIGATDYTGNITLYAKWEVIVIITVTLNSQEATNAGTTVVYYKPETTKFYSNSACTAGNEITGIITPVKTYYMFMGYYADSQGTGTQCIGSDGLFGTYVPEANITLYAKWQEFTIAKVTLDDQNATTLGTTEIYYKPDALTYYSDLNCTAENEITDITVPARTYYTFCGYYEKPFGAGTLYVTAGGALNQFLPTEDDTTFYAYWTLDTLTEFAGGVGTYADPYLISELAHLEYLASMTNAAWPTYGIYFKQTANIVVNEGTITSSSSSATQWTPIGNATNQFEGMYDGGGFTISGIYINGTASYQGLFGYVNGVYAVVENVGVVNSYIKGGDYVAGVCGYNNLGSINNCYSTAEIKGDSRVGGICGESAGATIEGCYNTGKITGSGDYVGGISGYTSALISNSYNRGDIDSTGSYVGGICGESTGDAIATCYNTASVSGASYIGGISGKITNTTLSIAYNTGTVEGTNYVGGVCGDNNGGTIQNVFNTKSVTGNDRVGGVTGCNNNGIVENCYNAGNVTGASNAGGVCGHNNNTISNAYYLQQGTEFFGIGNTEGDTNSQTAVKTAEEMKTTNFAGELGDDIFWQDNDTNNGFPYLIGLEFGFVTGTENTPYLISNAEDLKLLSSMIASGYTATGVYFQQTANIVVNEGTITAESTSATPWTPIGSATTAFQGTYDGNGFTISGLYIAGTSDYQGLFGYNAGTIRNVGVINSYINGNNYVGAVCGYNTNTITKCYSSATVDGAQNIGGVCGFNFGTLINSYNTGTVNGDNYTGGVVGYNSTGYTVGSSYNAGTVSGQTNTGGVCGYNYGIITNSYNTNIVNGTENVGGIVGYNYSNGEITNCYNVGSVTGTTTVGGVSGGSGDKLTNCYYLTGSAKIGDVAQTGVGTLIADATGVVVSKTDANMKNTTFAKALSSAFWQNSSINGSYPYLVVNGFVYGVGTESSPILINNASDLILFASLVNSGYTGQGSYFKQTADISLNDEIFTFMPDSGLVHVTDGVNTMFIGTGTKGDASGLNTQFDTTASSVGVIYYYISETYLPQSLAVANNVLGYGINGCINLWTPIGTTTNKFIGNYDGNNFEISGIYINNTTNYQGLFGYINTGAIIKNVVIENSYVKGGQNTGGVCGYNYGGQIIDCVHNAIVNGASSYIAGICGYMYYNSAIISGCSNNGVISSSTSYASGVCGYNYYGLIIDSYNTGFVSGTACISGVAGRNYYATMRNCYNTGTIMGTSNDTAGVCSYNGYYGKMYNCYNTGIIIGGKNQYGDSYVGGVCGYSEMVSVIEDSYNTGPVTGTGESVGGVYGEIWDVTVTNCYNTGKVTGVTNVGGVSGKDYEGTVTNCYNTGEVSGKDYVGGVQGYSNLEITNSWNSGMVTGVNYVGGFAGKTGESTTNCFNVGNVIATGSGVGGFAGTCNGGGGLTNCYNMGNVTGGNYVGGLYGYNYRASSYCYTTGQIIATGSDVGGGYGYNSSGSLTKCYYLSGSCSAAGGATALTETNMKKSTSYSGWDFSTVWAIDSTGVINNGYPYLISNPPVNN